jgi:hypothetical protein
MPQHLLKVSAAKAKSFFGVVIADNPPLSSDEQPTTMPAPQNVRIVRVGGNVPPVLPPIKEFEEQQESKNGSSLF